MNSYTEMRPQVDSTSAGGAMLAPVRVLVIGLMLAGSGTSSAQALPVEIISRSKGSEPQTSAGDAVLREERAGLAIGKLRRISGLTWDELARLFGVSRRSLHYWASGKTVSSANEEHLQRSLGVILRIDRGTARANRKALLSVGDDGVIPYDLLASREYEAVVSIVGESPTMGRVTLLPLSAEATQARTPRPPGERVGDIHDRVHRDAGRPRAAKSVRTRGAP